MIPIPSNSMDFRSGEARLIELGRNAGRRHAESLTCIIKGPMLFKDAIYSQHTKWPSHCFQLIADKRLDWIAVSHLPSNMRLGEDDMAAVAIHPWMPFHAMNWGCHLQAFQAKKLIPLAYRFTKRSHLIVEGIMKSQGCLKCPSQANVPAPSACEMACTTPPPLTSTIS